MPRSGKTDEALPVYMLRYVYCVSYVDKLRRISDVIAKVLQLIKKYFVSNA